MPSRVIRAEYPSSPSLAVCSPAADDHFPRYWLAADDYGCFEILPASLRSALFPYRLDMTDAQIVSELNEYASRRAYPGASELLEVWREGGRLYGFFRSWCHQQRRQAEPGTPGASPKLKRKTPMPPSVRPFGGLAAYHDRRTCENRLSRENPRILLLPSGQCVTDVSGLTSAVTAGAGAGAYINRVPADDRTLPLFPSVPGPQGGPVNIALSEPETPTGGVLAPDPPETAGSHGKPADTRSGAAHANAREGKGDGAGDAGTPPPRDTPAGAGITTLSESDTPARLALDPGRPETAAPHGSAADTPTGASPAQKARAGETQGEQPETHRRGPRDADPSRAKTTRRGPSERVMALREVFAEAYRRKYSVPPRVEGPEWSQLGRAYQAWRDGDELFREMLRSYVADDWPFYGEQSHSLRLLSHWLSTRWPRLAAKRRRMAERQPGAHVIDLLEHRAKVQPPSPEVLAQWRATAAALAAAKDDDGRAG